MIQRENKIEMSVNKDSICIAKRNNYTHNLCATCLSEIICKSFTNAIRHILLRREC